MLASPAWMAVSGFFSSWSSRARCTREQAELAASYQENAPLDATPRRGLGSQVDAHEVVFAAEEAACTQVRTPRRTLTGPR
jgi:hypothetical protein